MLIEKEIIGPGCYWYSDEKTGKPRKLVVTPEHTKYWRDEGSKMLSSGLTVPVPCEHDFNAHPMTPAEKLLNNAGWVKEYRLKNVTDPKTKKERKDVLFGVVDIQNEELANKLPRTIRWTSPWINSFTDGSGKQWNNVISHLALTTRPRIVEQEPFSSIAAALSLAVEVDLPTCDDDIVLSTDSSGHEHAGKGVGGGRFVSKEERTRDAAAASHASLSSVKKPKHAERLKGLLGKLKGDNKAKTHKDLHSFHMYLAESGSGSYSHHANAAKMHLRAAKAHGHIAMSVDSSGFSLSRMGQLIGNRPMYPIAFSLYAGGIKLAEDDMLPMKKKGKKPPEDTLGGGDDDDDTGDDDDLDLDSLTATPDKPAVDAKPGATPAAKPDAAAPATPTTPDATPATPGMPPPGDVGMEELLCDLLQALGVPMPDESNEQEFQRHLYEAAMSKIKELTSKGMTPPQPPQNPNLPKGQPKVAAPGRPGQQPNPLIQQEQQPMYMSLDDIQKIEDTTMRTVALSMYQQNEELRQKLEANEQRTNALQATKLAEETKKRQTRIQMLGRLAPKAKEQMESMAGLAGYALSLSADGTVVDPMKATLDMLESGLANMPRLLTTEQTSLSVMPQPTDAEMLSAEGEQKLVDDMSRMMGCAPEKQAS